MDDLLVYTGCLEMAKGEELVPQWICLQDVDLDNLSPRYINAIDNFMILLTPSSSWPNLSIGHFMKLMYFTKWPIVVVYFKHKRLNISKRSLT